MLRHCLFCTKIIFTENLRVCLFIFVHFIGKVVLSSLAVVKDLSGSEFKEEKVEFLILCHLLSRS